MASALRSIPMHLHESNVTVVYLSKSKSIQWRAQGWGPQIISELWSAINPLKNDPMSESSVQ